MILSRRESIGLSATAALFAHKGAAAFPRRALQALPASAARPAATTTILTPGRYDYSSALARMSREIDRHLATHQLPGATVAVADAHGFSAIIVAGWADIESEQAVEAGQLFQIGSISKSLAGLAVLNLVDKRRLRLDTRIREVLPEAPLPESTDITVRHLLSHSSGLAEDAPLFPPDHRRLWLGFAPGTSFSYSNLGYYMLGLVAERASGLPYHEFLRESVLQPLGMRGAVPHIRVADRAQYAASYVPFYNDRPYVVGHPIAPAPWINYEMAGGCVAATPADMAAYLQYLIRAGSGGGAPILSDEMLRVYLTPTVRTPQFGPDARYAAGLVTMRIDGRNCLHHTGGMISFASSLTIDVESGIGCFASVNASLSTSYRPREITTFALDALRLPRDGDPVPQRRAISGEPTVTPGLYTASDGEQIKIIAEASRLTVMKGVQRFSLLPDDDGFIAAGPDEHSSYLHVNRRSGQTESIGWGASLYHRGGTRPSDLNRADLLGFAGTYNSNDPWIGQRIIEVRPNGLWLDGKTQLVPLGHDEYQIGEDPKSPERAWFGDMLGGRPQKLTLSGLELTRL